MKQSANYLPYESTGYFSKIVSDYLAQAPGLRAFYQHSPDMDGIQQAIAARQAFPTDRGVLVDVLKEQYQNISLSASVSTNIEALGSKDTFTITTAHQPNIFTGPLYFIYKIMHAVKLAEDLAAKWPQYKFVPVYYMGSEDADLEELGYVYVGGEKLVWETKQTGAVGRMKVDKALVKLIHAINGQTGVLPFGKDLNSLFANVYTEGKTIQQATLELVNSLFSDYGVVVLIPDNAKLKSLFRPVVEKELLEGFSHKAVAATITALTQHYKAQAGGREINLFYLTENKRERIEAEGAGYAVNALNLHFTKEQILEELQQHPERFSGNVILRGSFQETVLPNIVFIGGGGELAYWLELKKVFEAITVPYPVLLLRNSFLFIRREQRQRMVQIGFSETELFKDVFALTNQLVKRESANQLNLEQELAQARQYYGGLRKVTDNVDRTLSEHVSALETKALKKLTELEKKILRAERAKYQAQQQQINKLKSDLFPANSLQERIDNFSLYYSAYGKEWLKLVHDVSKGLSEGFGVVTID